jgi:hypothetical protein
MTVPSDPKELVTLQELAVSNAYEIAALVVVLERKGILILRGPCRSTSEWGLAR